ncbi:hypothetical protein CKA32_005680 [Geitlerinema sp. FC II]|nr:hypothetical protein CKA32_005680 [Geitlerinema sp. FC II]
MGNGERGMGNGEWGMGNGKDRSKFLPLSPSSSLPFSLSPLSL